MRLAVWFVSAIYPHLSPLCVSYGYNVVLVRSFAGILIYLNMLLVTLPD